MRASQQGLLLVEAVLSAVVIATGLVFISRGLGGQLRALEAVEAHDTLLPLAQSKLAELEGWGLKQAAIPSRQLSGQFPEPYQAYRWKVETAPHPVGPESPPLTDVALTVQGSADSSRVVVLSAVWPSSWF